MNSKYLNLSLDLQTNKRTITNTNREIARIGKGKVTEISLYATHNEQQKESIFDILCKRTDKIELKDYKLRHSHTLSHSHFKVGMVEPNEELQQQQKQTNETMMGEN